MIKKDEEEPKTVLTASGITALRSEVTKIKGEFFLKNKEAFEVEGKWYRPESNLIFKDWETGKWHLNSSSLSALLIKGIVDFKDGKPVYGCFTRNPFKNVEVYDDWVLMAISAELLALNDYVEDISTGKWYLKKSLSTSSLNSLKKIQNKINYQKKGYNIEDNSSEFFEKIEKFQTWDVALSKDVRRYARMLGDTTWGVEIECSHGYLPDHLQYQTGTIICRDGSLLNGDGTTGPEFVTIPLSGAKGLQTTVNLANELRNRTLLDIKCSLHIHYGNLPTSRLFLVTLYTLGIKIQDELFKMFPYYKTDWKQSGKEKDYCQKLKKLGMGVLNPDSKDTFDKYVNSYYSKLFYMLSQSQTGSGFLPSQDWNRKTLNHPVPQKWQRKNRYFWLNLLNTIFSPRNTIEIRLHTPTTNSQKIINWLFICNAIIKYAMLHPREILTSGRKISLNDVLGYYREMYRMPQGEILTNYLQAYVKDRTAYFKKDLENKDYLSLKEMQDDKNYEFKFDNITHLF